MPEPRATRRTRRLWLACVFALLWTATPQDALSQDNRATVRVRVHAGNTPVSGADVRGGGARAMTDSAGRAVLVIEPGRHIVTARAAGFSVASSQVAVAPRADTLIVLELERDVVEIEEIIVASTRTGRRIEDEPVRVEVLTRDEIEEKMLMTPGDISMMLNETSGLRVQTTAPSLGGANVRIQGLRGRYTQLLADGLPLYGGQGGALGMLQIPPMDLAQVEVIKGIASALYGGSALGGVVNLISRRPADDRELLFNHTTRGGRDGVLWLSGKPHASWGYTLLAGGHQQDIQDVDDDGWADLPAHRRGVLRPRLFYDDGEGRAVFATIGLMQETREGGTLRGATAPDGAAHVEALDTRRMDAGVVARLLLGEDRLLSVRGSYTAQRHEHVIGSRLERDRHTTAFGEASIVGSTRGHTWVAGAALQRDGYVARDVAGFDHARVTPSLFVQDEVHPPTGWCCRRAGDSMRSATSARC
jgi:outer membrane receptor for ferrienterochelin and colicins